MLEMAQPLCFVVNVLFMGEDRFHTGIKDEAESDELTNADNEKTC